MSTTHPTSTYLEPLVKTVEKWLTSTQAARDLPTPPPELLLEAHPLTKHNHASFPPADRTSFSADMSFEQESLNRSGSPKRRRVEDDGATDEVDPGQSASQIGRVSALSLSEHNTFSPLASRVSSSAIRVPSPTRETPIILRKASPPVLAERSTDVRMPIQVQQLGDYLQTNIETHFIPLGFKQIMMDDADLGHQATKPADFAPADAQTPGDLTAIWTEIKAIFLDARDCHNRACDENAWSDDVFRPLIRLAIKLYGDDRWRLQNVKSQSIDPRYLSTVPAPTRADPARRKVINRKTDYVLSYSHRHPATAALYNRLETGNRGEISHTIDVFTKRIALFSGFEIKPGFGSRAEAELQINVWSAASLVKKQELVRCAQLPLDLAALVEPMFIIVGHEHYLYYSYPHIAAGRMSVHVLGPDSFRFPLLSTYSIRGIFRLLRLYGNVLRYGANEDEDGYWGGVLGKSLNRLAGLTGEQAVSPE